MSPDFALTEWFDLDTGRFRSGREVTERRLSDLAGCFADESARLALLEEGDALVYAITAFDGPQGEGDLHYGLGVLYPGKIGEEYFMTKGHLHTWRPAAEVYIGLAGRGVMLLECETTCESRLEPLEKGSIVYVPGWTAHRTLNTGAEPLVYIGIYPARAGHDYAALAARNFRSVVVEQNGRPVCIERTKYLGA